MASIHEQDPSFFRIYESPFSYRYGSKTMKEIWSEENRWLKARDLWIAVAQTQMEAGLVSTEEVADLATHRGDLDIATILRREMDRNDPRYTGHDVVAAISEFADKAPIGARIIHQGMTSEDVLSNVEALLIKEAFAVVEERVKSVLNAFGNQIEQHKDLICMGFTHLQAAEPTTLGYRLARYAQDFLADLRTVRFIQSEIKGKGIKGAVGTSASFTHLLEGTGMSAEEHERKIMTGLGLEPVTVSGQTYPRKMTMQTIFVLTSVAQSCHQFAADLKILQSSPFGELAEPRRRSQIGSSAMPWKENPNNAENIKSLSRGLIGKVVEGWINASEVTLERGLEDSAGKRSCLPEGFLIIDECLSRTERIIRGLQVRETAIQRNMATFGPFAASEMVLTELTKRGADRQAMHEALRVHGQTAQEALRRGEPNPFGKLVAGDQRITRYLPPEEIEALFAAINTHVGDAPQRCDKFLAEMRAELEKGG